MGPVRAAIRATYAAPISLYTFGQHKPFELSGIDDLGIVLLSGEGDTRVRLWWDCLEGIPGFLDGRGWVRAAGTSNRSAEPETLDEYLSKRCTPALVSRWLVVVLEDAGVIDVRDERPLLLRLRPGFGTMGIGSAVAIARRSPRDQL